MSVPAVLSIAGSDPSGGAGIQADLKTFGALGAYGCAVITALTAQSTKGVTGVHHVPAAFVREQVETLVDDVDVSATKIGMLGSAEVAGVVGELLVRGRLGSVVLDPVMVSTAGSRLLDEDAVQGVRDLLPLVDLVTPNTSEAAVLLDLPLRAAAADLAAMRRHAGALLELGATRVLLKGGHVPGEEAVDVLADADGVLELRAPRVRTRHTHGTGCTLSSAIAALRPRRAGWTQSVSDAKEWLGGALAHADELSIGHGAGPVHHHWQLWSRG